MNPGRELDALIAEKVMGWTWKKFKHHGADHSVYFNHEKTQWLGPSDFNPKVQPGFGLQLLGCSVPPYSSEISAAWNVLEKANITQVMKMEKGEWMARFDGPTNENGYYAVRTYRGEFATSYAFGSTPAHAICLAALKSIDYQP